MLGVKKEHTTHTAHPIALHISSSLLLLIPNYPSMRTVYKWPHNPSWQNLDEKGLPGWVENSSKRKYNL